MTETASPGRGRLPVSPRDAVLLERLAELCPPEFVSLAQGTLQTIQFLRIHVDAEQAERVREKSLTDSIERCEALLAVVPRQQRAPLRRQILALRRALIAPYDGP